jgi:hypothetical protein
MTIKTLSINEVKSITIEELVYKVLAEQTVVTIRLSEEDAVTIQPHPKLKPLPVLNGYVPEGWKEAIYG